MEITEQQGITETFEGQDLTKGDMRKQMWSLAWPMMLSFFFYTLYNLVDAYWVSKVSDEAIAAVSISQITLFVMVSLGFGITVGSGVLMSMHIGAKKNNEAERVLGQSFVLSMIAGAFFTIVSLVFRNEFLIASGASGAIFAPAMEYFVIVASGSILLFLLMTVMFSFNSQGDTFTLTKFFAISTIVNVVLDPVMIFGWFGFPQLGIAGAAYATLISQAVFIVIALRSLAGTHRQVRFRFRNLTLNVESVKKVLNIGIPAALTQVIFPLGLAALTFITVLSFFEPGAVAFSLGFRIEFFAFLPAVGFGFAAMAMIGQNIGAGNKDRAREAFHKALRYSFFAAAGFGVLVAICAKPIVSVFTTDPIVTQYALSYMWTVSISYGFLAALMVEASSFQAMGKSWPGFWLFVLRVGSTLGLAYVLTYHLQLPIMAVWGSVIFGNILASTVGYFWITNTLEKASEEDVSMH